jgi:hypothetical protein
VDTDLSPATIQDMVAELERRGLAVAIVVSHVQAQSYVLSPDVPPADREKVYGDTFHSKHPAFTAAFLCDGIQWCLTELPLSSWTVELSWRMQEVKNHLWELVPTELR